jgi:hypothetical protein
MFIGRVTLVESTLSANSAAVSALGEALGGGIDNDTGTQGTLSIQNTILAGNNAPSSADLSGSLTSLGHDLIGIGDGGSGYAATDLVGTAASPLDPLLGPLQDNGGPTQMMALLPGSPAIDAGALTDMEWDQRGPGYPRLVNGATDIGAYEVQDSAGSTPAAQPGLFAEAILRVQGTALNRPVALAMDTSGASMSRLPPSPAAVAVDRLFASSRKEAAAFHMAHLGHPVATETEALARDLVAREDTLLR